MSGCLGNGFLRHGSSLTRTGSSSSSCTDGEPAVADDSKAALPWRAPTERTLGKSRGGDSRGHGNRSTDECVDCGIVSEDAEESLYATTAWLSSTNLKGLESGEPVGGRCDDGWGRTGWESRRRREEGDKVVCDETLVSVRYGELAWAGCGTVDDCRYMDIKGSQALCSRVEQAVSRQDVYQSKRLVSTNESVLVSESLCNRSHSSIGIGAFLVIEQGHALCGDWRHF